MNLEQRKFQLLDAIAEAKSQRFYPQNLPITDIELDTVTGENIASYTEQLEAVNPNPQPLLNNPQLLDGAWLLRYSTAREIRSLASLPFGFKLGEVYQVIDLASGSFFNQAFCKHISEAIMGYVKVTATFKPAPAAEDGLNRKIYVNFKRRSIVIEKIFGLPSLIGKPLKEVDAKPPVGRIPSLTITYLDEDLRIGRGGDGSLFILSKAKDFPL